jgi:hypothetical protein
MSSYLIWEAQVSAIVSAVVRLMNERTGRLFP